MTELTFPGLWLSTRFNLNPLLHALLCFSLTVVYQDTIHVAPIYRPCHDIPDTGDHAADIKIASTHGFESRCMSSMNN